MSDFHMASGDSRAVDREQLAGPSADGGKTPMVALEQPPNGKLTVGQRGKVVVWLSQHLGELAAVKPELVALAKRIGAEIGVALLPKHVVAVAKTIGLVLKPPRVQVGGVKQAAVIDGLLAKIDALTAEVRKLTEDVRQDYNTIAGAFATVSKSIDELSLTAVAVKGKIEYASETVERLFALHNESRKETAKPKTGK